MKADPDEADVIGIVEDQPWDLDDDGTDPLVTVLPRLQAMREKDGVPDAAWLRLLAPKSLSEVDEEALESLNPLHLRAALREAVLGKHGKDMGAVRKAAEQLGPVTDAEAKAINTSWEKLFDALAEGLNGWGRQTLVKEAEGVMRCYELVAGFLPEPVGKVWTGYRAGDSTHSIMRALVTDAIELPGTPALIKHLIDLGACVEGNFDCGRTHLLYALSVNNNIAKLLLDHGADPTAPLTEKDGIADWTDSLEAMLEIGVKVKGAIDDGPVPAETVTEMLATRDGRSELINKIRYQGWNLKLTYNGKTFSTDN